MIVSNAPQIDPTATSSSKPRVDRKTKSDSPGASDAADKARGKNTDRQTASIDDSSKTSPTEASPVQSESSSMAALEFASLVQAALNLVPAHQTKEAPDTVSDKSVEAGRLSSPPRLQGLTLAAKEQQKSQQQDSGSGPAPTPVILPEAAEEIPAEIDAQTINPADGVAPKINVEPLADTPAPVAQHAPTPLEAGDAIEQAKQNWAPVLIKRAGATVEARMDTPAGQVLVTGKMTGTEATVIVAAPAALRPQLSQDGQMPEFQEGAYRWDWQQDRQDRPERDSEES